MIIVLVLSHVCFNCSPSPWPFTPTAPTSTTPATAPSLGPSAGTHSSSPLSGQSRRGRRSKRTTVQLSISSKTEFGHFLAAAEPTAAAASSSSSSNSSISSNSSSSNNNNKENIFPLPFNSESARIAAWTCPPATGSIAGAAPVARTGLRSPPSLGTPRSSPPPV